MGLILGSDLGQLGDAVADAAAVPFSGIPGFPVGTAPGHAGRLLLGRLSERPVVVMQGRVHMHDGVTPASLAFPVRVMRLLGVRTLIANNAAGGLNPAVAVGHIMLIRDHISLPGLSGFSPLSGPNLEEFGERCPAINHAYSPRLAQMALETAEGLGISLQQGVYEQAAGPQFESPAEIRMLRAWGGDAVGMCTAPEIIAAKHAGMEAMAFSTIANKRVDTLDSEQRPDSDAVLDAANLVTDDYQRLLNALITRIA